MTHYLRINLQALGAQREEPSPGSKPRELYARCNSADPRTCDLFSQIAGMVPKDRKAALAALSKLIEVAASGKPITEFYDKKQCHDINTFKYKNKDRTIWRIWKGDVVRVTFYYGEGQTVLLTHAFAKYEDKLSSAQKKALEYEVEKYVDALDEKTIKFIEKK
jgi:hypothetical protein